MLSHNESFLLAVAVPVNITRYFINAERCELEPRVACSPLIDLGLASVTFISTYTQLNKEGKRRYEISSLVTDVVLA